MTNHWIDLKNSDVILIMGANPAENHPISFRWVVKAREERGAKVIHVDPRYTKTSSQADVYVPLRSGTDIAFLGGLIKYLLDRDLVQKDYVVNYTNASFLIQDEFDFDPLTGFFSGYNQENRSYDKKSWSYQMVGQEPKTDPTLQNPKCVYQLLKKHYSRYELSLVSRITGTSEEDLLKVYKLLGETSVPNKVATSMYAMGWTQHSVGTQNIRAMAIIQLLLGNMGMAGGGINALRGESNVQGSTDHGLLFHILPGYLKTPMASQVTLEAYMAANTPATIGKQSANWWSNTPAYIVSFLKSMYGKNATKENEFGYGWLPKLDDGGNYSWLALFDEMHKGNIKGLMAWGMNPACSGSNSNKVRKSLAKLDWLVNVNIFPNETGWFFQDPNLGIKSSDIPTEVFVLPCAASLEKEGSISNSGRWMQWRYKAADAPGDALPDAEIMHLIFTELKALYKSEGGAFPEPMLNTRWEEYFHHHEADPHLLAKDINGVFLKDVTVRGTDYKKGQQVPSFAMLQADGSTSSGCWIYAGSYTDAGNMAARRKRGNDPLGLNPEWSWCWPVNRRVIYNRASVDIHGRPLDPKRPLIAWQDGKWVGDVPDGPWPPLAVDPENGRYPFIMLPEGRGRLFAFTLADGPFPEHYEPLESPLSKNLLNASMFCPAAKVFESEDGGQATCGGAEYPYVCSTYRVTEHWQTGVMTRHTPWLLEAVPQLFLEMSLELAKEKGIAAGDRVRVISARGELHAVALPTMRLKPITVDGRIVHHVGLPWCFGWVMPEGGRGGDSANLLTPDVGDANTFIPESKAFLVNIERIGAKSSRALALK